MINRTHTAKKAWLVALIEDVLVPSGLLAHQQRRYPKAVATAAACLGRILLETDETELAAAVAEIREARNHARRLLDGILDQRQQKGKR